MRQTTPNKRLRSRSRKSVSPLARVYDSNGPDVKVRGSAQQVAEKYAQLSRDAQSAGDRVMAENYLQHAEHYYRLLAAAQPNGSAREEREETYRDDRDEAIGTDEQPREIRDDLPRERDERGYRMGRNGAPTQPRSRENGSYASDREDVRETASEPMNGANGHAHTPMAEQAEVADDNEATPFVGEETLATQTDASHADGGAEASEQGGGDGTDDDGGGRRGARRGRTRAGLAGGRARSTRVTRTSRNRRSSNLSGNTTDGDAPKTDA